MALTRSRQALGAAALAVAVTAAACSSGGSSGGSPGGSGGGASAPGVTSNSVTVGTVATITGPVPGLFKGAVDGVEAYFAYVNSQGGVNGRQLKVQTGDDALSCTSEASAVSSLLPKVFAFVGSFSLLDDCGVQNLSRSPNTPWVAYTFGSHLRKLPQAYSPLPNGVGYATGGFQYIEQHYGVHKVGFLYSQTSAATLVPTLKVLQSTGIDVAYQRGTGTTETTFNSDIVRMKQLGVDWVYAQYPPSFLKNMLSEIRQQNFHPKVIEDDAAYDASLTATLGDPSLAEGLLIAPGYGLFLGEDAKQAPGVALLDKWFKQVDPSGRLDLYAAYGWASAELFVDALKKAGHNPTQGALLTALKGIHSFDTQGLQPITDPGNKTPAHCFLVAQFKQGAWNRVHPATGFDCSGQFKTVSGS